MPKNNVLKRIAVKELRVGMFIHEFCGSWMEHPFFRARFLLNSEEDLQRILDTSIAEVWIDVSQGADVAERVPADTFADVSVAAEMRLQSAEPPVDASSSSPVIAESTSLEEELGRAAEVCRRSREAVMSMFRDVRMGQAVQIEQAGELVEEISASVMRHPTAFVSLARLKNADEYTYMHSVAVCALMIALARQLKLDESLVREAGLAGLLHDLGKMFVPEDVLNKPGRLTDEEFDQVRLHPVAGARVLLEGRQVSKLVIDVCLHHHEKIDGSGYPHRLTAERISRFARMGAVCDVYDAVTSDRPYKRGWDPAEAVRKMAEWSGHFDERIFHAFVKSVGIYPTGSLVRLESGRLGVVIEQGGASLLEPKIRVFYSIRSGMPIALKTLDLSLPGTTDRIVARESAKAWGFRDLDRLWLDIGS